MERVLLAHGSGGVESHALIKELFWSRFGGEILARGEDAGVVEIQGKIAMSTDGYVVTPRFFPGGDIGKLAVCGSANDVAMMGARPRYMSCSFVIEEGFLVEELKRIVSSMATELERGGIGLLSGDTKVVPRGSMDGLFITTTALGEVVRDSLSCRGLKEGDAILVSGAVGTHGAVIYAAREEIGFQSALVSDCAQLWECLEPLMMSEIPLHAVRDATRGGLAAVLNEWSQSSACGIGVRESALPCKSEVRGICELLGFEPYNLANEGMCVIALPRDYVNEALELLRQHPCAQEAACIGEVTASHPGRVVLENAWGGKRYLDYPSGELLPRIC